MSIEVTYQISCASSEVEAIARDIALEQTVEVPEALVPEALARDGIVGRIEAIEPLADMLFAVKISFRAALASGNLSQLLNLIYGNISIKNNIRILDVVLPASLLDTFSGPRFGIRGVRERLGIFQRPLLCTALKPRGSSVEHLAGLARQFALGGGDIVKDDHNLVDESFDEFMTRVRACHEAVEESNRETGQATLYCPNISAATEEVEKRMNAVRTLGISGVLVAPALLGFDFVRHMSERFELIMMSHPTFTGTFFQDTAHGIEPSVLLGTLFRLLGVDISVYPNAGGRFGFTRAQCTRLAEKLREPFGNLPAAWPAPAGGMRLENIPTMCDAYGQDAVLICGGALLSEPGDLRASTERLLDGIRAKFGERREKPRRVPSRPAGEGAGVKKFSSASFEWSQCERIAYKGEKRLPFEGISRIELFGKHDARADFDVRYFEIEPDGFSSCERHMHTHCVIGCRGSGILVLDGTPRTLEPFDVIHIPPMAVHQLRNNGAEPFGFFCIVDRKRDKPLGPE